MSEPTQPQGEQPANEVNPDSPNGEQPQDAVTLEAQLENLTPAELAQALGFESSPMAPTDAEPDEKAPQETTPEEPGEQPEEPEAEPTEQPKPTNRRRLSVTGLPDADREMNAAAIAMVREGQAGTLLEAMQILAGHSTTPAPSNDDGETRQPSTPEEQPEAPPTLLELEARFDSANEELADAIREFDQDKQIQLTKEINTLNRRILKAEQAEVETQQQVTGYKAEYLTAVDEMETKYADLLDDENSPFSDLLDDKIEAAKARRDPSLSDPRHILAFADQIANTVLKVQSQAPRKEAGPVPARPKTVVGGLAPSHKVKAQLTGKQAEEFIENASKEVLAAALWG